MSVTAIQLPTAYAVGTYAPVLDVVGTNPDNTVLGEVQVVAANQGSDYLVVIPKYAPFFASYLSATFTDVANVTTPLTAGVDFEFALPFISASRAVNQPIFGGIVMKNNQLVGKVTVNYHPIGGDWTFSRSIDEANDFIFRNNPYIAAWEQYATYTYSFPVVYSAWDKPDPKSGQDLCAAVTKFTDAYIQKALAIVTSEKAGIAHISDINNPHGTIKADIGLAKVANLPPATDAEAGDPTNNHAYISPAQLEIAFNTITPTATDLASGVMGLNNGLEPNAATDAVRALTAAGFVALAGNVDNPLGKALNTAQQEASFVGWNNVWPKTWAGVSYPTAKSLKAALEKAAGIYPLEVNLQTGKVWYPANTTLPDLTLS